MSEGLNVKVYVAERGDIVITEDSGPLRLVIPKETMAHIKRGAELRRDVVLMIHKDPRRDIHYYALVGLFKDYIREETGREVDFIWMSGLIGVVI